MWAEELFQGEGPLVFSGPRFTQMCTPDPAAPVTSLLLRASGMQADSFWLARDSLDLPGQVFPLQPWALRLCPR